MALSPRSISPVVSRSSAPGRGEVFSATAAEPGPFRPGARGSSRESILDAAEAVVLADGAAHLTLDAVAERAKVSKGGLLYNFPSKELLLQAMIDRHMQQVDQDHSAALAQLAPGPGRELKAAVLMAAERPKSAEEKCLGGAMLAAAANNPKLLEPVQRFQRWRLGMLKAAAEDGLPFERAAIASLAVDGLSMLEMLRISPFSAEQRERILADLLCLIEETATGRCPPIAT